MANYTLNFCVSARFLLICAAFLGPINLQAQVVINEVMFDPSGSEFFDEYIELFNAGDVAVDLSGWRIGDGEQTNVLVGETMVLQPGQFALVLDAGYQMHSTHYDPLPKDALKLTVDSPTLGRNGLSNVRSESIVLIQATGDTVAVAFYQPGNVPGVSEEKVDATLGDGPQNWVDARWAGGTPGRVNSVSVKDRDLLFLLTSESPIQVPWGESVAVIGLVKNIGREAVASFSIQVSDGSHIVGRALLPGDSVQVEMPVANLVSGHRDFSATLVVEGDHDETNHTVMWTIIAGLAPGQVVINEVMSMPLTGEPEWVELFNPSDAAIDLLGWTLADVRTIGRIEESVTIDGMGFVVLTEDVSGFQMKFPNTNVPVLALSRWPKLNDGGDALRLLDASQGVVDSIAFPSGSRDVSLERIDVADSGVSASNWLVSTSFSGATPGMSNSVQFVEEVPGVTLVADPNPFVEQVRITYQLPTPRAFTHLWVYDRAGRRIATLLENAEGGGQRIVNWDGRQANGQMLKPGIYVLYLEASTPNGQRFHARKPLVLARGIGN